MQMEASSKSSLCAYCGSAPKAKSSAYCTEHKNQYTRLKRQGKTLPKIQRVEPSALKYVKYRPYQVFMMVCMLKRSNKWIPWLYEHKPPTG